MIASQLTQLQNKTHSQSELKELIKSPDFFKCSEVNDRKNFSKIIDNILQFKIEDIENTLLKYAMEQFPSGNMGTWGPNLYDGSQTWVGIDPQTLQTPYGELYDIVEILSRNKINNYIDFGSGYGRLAIVIHSFLNKDNYHFLGYEVVEQRAKEANRIFNDLELISCSTETTDITKSNFKLPKSQAYFIYDFSNPVHIKGLLTQISDIYFSEEIMIVARGDGIRSLIQEKFPQFYSNFTPIYDMNWTIYSSYKEID